MKSYNPTYGLWNDGEDEVKSSKKYGARALDTSVEEAGRANRELLKKGIIRKVDE